MDLKGEKHKPLSSIFDMLVYNNKWPLYLRKNYLWSDGDNDSDLSGCIHETIHSTRNNKYLTTNPLILISTDISTLLIHTFLKHIEKSRHEHKTVSNLLSMFPLFLWHFYFFLDIFQVFHHNMYLVSHYYKVLCLETIFHSWWVLPLISQWLLCI